MIGSFVTLHRQICPWFIALFLLLAPLAAVEPVDRYALPYGPSHGTELALNERLLAVGEGKDFARA